MKKLKKYMCLTSSEQRYALPLSSVKEVVGLSSITPVPNSPVFLRGLINLRGKIITTLDFATVLDAKSATKSKRPSVIICATTEQSDCETHVGLIVDDILEVISIDEEKINFDVESLQTSGKAGVVGAIDLKQEGLTLVVKLEKTIAATGLNFGALAS